MPNGHHWHLIVNHFPIFGLFFAMLLSVAAIIWPRVKEVRRIVFGVLILVAIGTIPAFLTGEPAEHEVEELKGLGVSLQMMHKHEETAELAFILIMVVGGFGVIGFIAAEKKEQYTRHILAALLLGQLIAFGFTGLASNQGGEIRRPELRKESKAAIDTLKAVEHDILNHEEDD
ncbi:DUF1440 domain-containing protein [bacterium]|nr:DUF1440 domain-containing protein [bacterium]